MKIRLCILSVIAAAGVQLASAQEIPTTPENSGLQPRSATVYINNLDTINNGNSESLGVAIAGNGNVIVGWEDDAETEDLTYLGAVWTVLGPPGASTEPPVSVTPITRITSLIPAFAGQELNNNFLSYFRADDSATPGFTSWGPKIKANLFGTGLGMGATSYALGFEVPEFLDIQQDVDGDSDFPSVQLLTDAGAPARIVVGVTEDYAQQAGGIRIGDWHYLATGNVVVVGESRQADDLVTLYGGTGPGNHAIYRIVDPAGNEVKAISLVSEEPVPVNIWHGVGVTANGFAVRFEKAGRATVRMFDNAGNPTTGDLDLGTLTGFEVASGGGRGDSAGFHGNGTDAYIAVNKGTHESAQVVWVTVLNADGTVRWSKSAIDDLVLSAQLGDPDAAIEKNGEVIVVFSDAAAGNTFPFVMGKRLDASGEPIGSTFFVSELEDPSQFNVLTAVSPRVALRDGLVAVVWESDNDFTFGPVYKAVAMRMFAAYQPGTIESVGLTRLVDDTPIIVPTADALGNWEPYASVLGTSTFLIEGNTFAEGGVTDQRYVVALQPAAGGAMSLAEGFFSDDGQPFKGKINYSRQNGNPGRVAGDKRPGAVNIMVGGEASPYLVAGFQSDNRWDLGFVRPENSRFGTVQTFAIDPITLSQTMRSKAQDSAFGRMTSGTSTTGNQITRFGGDIVCLDNGNFVSVVEDKSRMFNPDGDAAVATIFAPDGSVVVDSFKVANSDLWANVAACQGGFVVRAKPSDGSTSRSLYFFDNDGALTGEVDQNTSGVAFDTGRGDGTRLAGHINSPYVYLAGRESGGTDVKIAVWDSRDASFVTVASVNEAGFAADADRANLAVDALDRFTASWVVRPTGYVEQQVAARVLKLDAEAKEITPLTGTFLPFINVGKTNGIRTLQMAVAMTTKEICIGAKGEINLENEPANGANSPREVNFYTVFTHPAPVDDPTVPVGGVVDAPELSVSAEGNQLTISWAPATAGFTLEQADSIGGTWSAGPAGNPVTVTATESARYYRLVKP